MDDIRLGSGAASLAKQLKYSIDHLNRGNVQARLRNSKTMKQTSSYGCSNPNPEIPLGESTESIESARKEMIDIYDRHGLVNSDKISRAIIKTYHGQRFDIHLKITMPAIKKK